MFQTKHYLIVLFLFNYLFSFAQDKPEVNLGGALRFNYNYSSWKEGQKKRGGDFGYDVFKINSNVSYHGIKLNAEYRLYANNCGGGMLKQGWIAYNFNKKNEIQLGLTQVPLGITKYNSNSWFFSLNYYIGLEDDHDMGLKFSHKGDRWTYVLAFFKNAEELRFSNNSDISNNRYSYDVSSIDLDQDGNPEHRNKEENQINGKVIYHIGQKEIKHNLGISGQVGGLYNLDTKKLGNHWALALHYELQANKFGIKAQVSKYKYNPNNPENESDDIIAMTAYGAPYLVASEACIYTLGLSYSIPVKWGPISSLMLYNDFGYLDKAVSNFENSLMNVTGALITAGSVYTYIDFATGKDQPWLGSEWTNALGKGSSNADLEMRFNINIGYYF